jgi:PAS domain S-box-containing protein
VVRELRRAGFEPVWQRVETEPDYLRALGPELDIVISDYSMPEFDGPRALRLLQERGLDIPFILVSGTVGEDAAVAAMKEGASDYLLKDRLTRLGPAVQQALEQRRLRRERARAEAELRRFVSASPAVIYALAVKDGILELSWISDNVTRLTGHDHQEALSGTWWAENVHPDDRERVFAAHPVPYELDHLLLDYRFQRKDGGSVWVRDEKRLLRSPDGQPVEVVGSFADITERKLAEAQRDDLTLQRKLALSAARLGWWHYDPSTGVTTWDERYKEIFGASGFEGPGDRILERLHPEDVGGLRVAVTAALDPANPKPMSTEYRVNHPDGSIRWVEAHGVASFGGEGDRRRATSFVGTVQDITERRQAESALAESEERLRLAMDAAGMGNWELDLATGKVIWSPRHFALFGLDPETRPSSEVWRSLVHPDDVERVLLAMETGRRERSTVALEYRIRRADNGRVTWLSEAGRFVYDAHGESVRFLGVASDATKRVEAERRQAMQHAVTRVLAESASLKAAAPGIIQAVSEIVGADFGALWEIDRQGNQLRCADLWRLPGASSEDLEAETRGITFAPGVGLPGRVWVSRAPLVLADLERDDNFSRAAAAQKVGFRQALAFPIMLRSEVAGVMEFLGPHVHDPDQELLDTLGGIGSQIGQFIEHRLAEQQLLQSQKMEAVGQLAGGIAHDFNNLLSVILGYAQLGAGELGPEHKTSRRLEAIRKAGERAAALTRQILTFSRKQSVDTHVCDLNHIVEDMEKMLPRLIGEDVRLVVALGEALGQVRADPGQLEQVIMNLAVNARDAMPAGGRLVIETSNVDLDQSYAGSHPEVQPGPHVMLAISDTGEGMAPGTLARIFEPFFTTKEAGKGTGLGLAVVFGIVKQSGGSVSVYSEPGEGSTFKVYLPRVFDTQSTAPTTAPEVSLGGSETVLVLEDEDALRALVVEALRAVGYTVLEAAEPRAAAAVASDAARKIHLLLTDVVLPGQSGPETAIQLRNARPDLRVVLMSGYTDKLVNGHRTFDPNMPFLGKPFTVDALLRKVREALDGASPVPGRLP